MSYMKESSSYVWFTNKFLGKGATATVYQGTHKDTGQSVAVKEFNNYCMKILPTISIKEFDILKQVDHENIVKLLAIEEERESKRSVIVMELCTGGCVLDILLDPEHSNGLHESEYLVFLSHLYSGVKYLRDKNLVHRDVKPANIMKFIKDDGSTVYKLTDFGAARELSDEEVFVSIYGTEEYLDPDVYEHGVLKKPLKAPFKATIDLWSIGTTLFHVATGNVPFRPYGGRRNKSIMYQIITTKGEDVISGIQYTAGGPIIYSKELPSDCLLSTGLKRLITPIIANLLTRNQEGRTFEDFFGATEIILKRKAINVFYVNKTQLITVYVDPDDTFTRLQDYIKDQTHVKPENQILLHKSSHCCQITEEYFRSNTNIYSTKEPLFLLDKENNDIIPLQYQAPPQLMQFSRPIVLAEDESKARYTCSIAYQQLRTIKNLLQICTLVCDCVELFSNYLNLEVKELNNRSKHLLKMKEIFMKTAKILQNKKQSGNGKTINYEATLHEISEEFKTSMAPNIEKLHKKHIEENKLQLEWEHNRKELKYDCFLAQAKMQVKLIRETWQRMQQSHLLSYADQQTHICDQNIIYKSFGLLSILLKNEVYSQYKNIAECFNEWYKKAECDYKVIKVLIENAQHYDDNLYEFNEILEEPSHEHIKSKQKVSKKKYNILQIIKSYQPESDIIKDELDKNRALVEQLKLFTEVHETDIPQ